MRVVALKLHGVVGNTCKYIIQLVTMEYSMILYLWANVFFTCLQLVKIHLPTRTISRRIRNIFTQLYTHA